MFIAVSLNRGFYCCLLCEAKYLLRIFVGSIHLVAIFCSQLLQNSKLFTSILGLEEFASEFNPFMK